MENNEKKQNNIALKKLFRILIIFFIIAMIFIWGFFVYKVIVVKKIMDNNVEVHLGNNYKIIKTEISKSGEERENVLYYKDGIVKYTGDNGKNVMIRNEESVYLYSTDHKNYYDVGKNDSVMLTYSEYANLTMNWFIAKEDVDSYFDVAKFVIMGRINLKNEIIDGKEYIAMNSFGDSSYLYVNKENYLCEICQGTSQKVEIGTITDEDLKMPWELGYELKETITTVNNY